MTRLLEHIYGALVAANDVLEELVDSQDARLQVMRQELGRAKELLDEALPATPLPTGRPTLAQARARALEIGVSEDEAEAWWMAREAVDWVRGTAGGGSLPIGKNWAADCKSFTNSTRQSRNGNGVNGHAPKTESVWHLKQSLEAVDAELNRLEEKAMYDGMSLERRDLKKKMQERRSELRRKIAGLGE